MRIAIGTQQIAQLSTKNRLTWYRRIVAIAIVLCLSGCSSPSTMHTTTRTMSTFPAFSDWRMAYVASDGHIHAISLDGKTDVTGPAVTSDLMDTNTIDTVFASSGISPDGHSLVYYAPDGLTALDLQGKRPLQQSPTPFAVDFAWAADGKQLASGDAAGNFYTFDTSGSLPPTHVPGTVNSQLREVFGWIDATHLLVGDFVHPFAAQPSYTYVLDSLDLTSGSLRQLALLQEVGLDAPRILLSPNGKQVLFYNAPLQNLPYTPFVDVIDLTTGAIAPLPHIAQGIQGAPESYAWQPGSNIVAISTGFIVNGDAKDWLLDLQHDTFTQFASQHFIGQWTPDGKALGLTTSQNNATATGPFTYSVATFNSARQATIQTLTQDAWDFRFLGFAQTAP